MIRALKWRFVALVMAIVTVMLLAIFFTLLISTRQSHAHMSLGFLEQALSPRGFGENERPRHPSAMPNDPPGDLPGNFPDAAPNAPRMAVLVLDIPADGAPEALQNQLHFLAEDDLAPLAAFITDSAKDSGTVPGYGLRFLRMQTEDGFRAAFTDTSVEQESLRAMMLTSLFIGGAAEIAFFVLSLLLARHAVRPAEIAWARQREFVANASHELKTPVTVILSNAELLLTDETEPAQTARRLDHIHAEALRMRRLVDDMLSLARSDSVAAIHAPVDFSDVVTNAVLTVEPLAFDAGKSLSCELSDGLLVMGDATRLHQVARILLDNALKYGADKSEIAVSLRKSDNRAVLCILSGGQPIPPEDLARIFQRFYRGGNGSGPMETSALTSNSYKAIDDSGFGLGLAIAQGIVAEHKGKIWAESDPSGGNRFFVSLPLE